MPPAYRKLFTEETEEQLLRLSRAEVTDDLMDKERMFCEQYIRNKNIQLAAVKAGYSKKSAHIVGWKVRQKPNVNRYICWLKLQISKTCHIDAMDIIDQYARIAFADITDFVEIVDNKIKLIDADEIDGQIVTKIKKGRDGGISLELADKFKALEKLEHYFDVMPADWKQKIEEKKLELMKDKLEFEKRKFGEGGEDMEDDGFIEALADAATEVWSD